VKLAWLFVTTLCLFSTQLTLAAEQSLLYEQTPFDTITLDEENKNAVIQVFALDVKDVPDRQQPQNPEPESEIIVRLLTNPDQQYRLKWKHIEKIRFFEQELLAEAQKLVGQKNFEQAFPYFRLLLSKYRTFPGVTDAYEGYLKSVIELAYVQEHFDQAIARILIWDEFRSAAGAVKKYGIPTLGKYWDKVSSQPTPAQLLQAARWFHELRKRDPSITSPSLTKLQQALDSRYAELIALAKTASQQKQIDQAMLYLQEAEELIPNKPGMQQFRASLESANPRLIVGLVHGPAANWSLESGAVDWSRRRDQRLLSSAPVELQDYKAGSVTYQTPTGTLSALNKTGQISLSGEDNSWAKNWSAIASEQSSAFIKPVPGKTPSWQLPGQLRAAQAQPFLSLARVPANPSESNTLGPRSFVNKAWQPNPNGIRPAPTTALPIQLQTLDNFDTAAAALQEGRVQVVDRVAPWQLPNLAKDKRFNIQPYRIPSVHLLICNPQSETLQETSYRIAVAAAINRQSLLQSVLRGAKIPDAKVATLITPKAVELPGAVLNELPKAAGDADLAKLMWQTSQSVLGKTPKLKMVAPRDEIAQHLAKEIASDLTATGINVELTISQEPFIPTAAEASQADLIYWYWHPIDANLDWSLMSQAQPWQGLAAAMATLNPAFAKLPQGVPESQLWQAFEFGLVSQRFMLPLLQLPEHAVFINKIKNAPTLPLDLFQQAADWQLQP
jgi:hypothetical protein